MGAPQFELSDLVTQAPPGSDVDAQQFREVMGRFLTGVTIVSTNVAGRPHGMTVNAMCSLSLHPPMLAVCLHERSPTQEAVMTSGRFAVNVLAADQADVARRFAAPQRDKFENHGWETGPHGQPLLVGSLTSLECEVAAVVRGSTHRIFLATLLSARSDPAEPLAYYQGNLGAPTRLW